MKTVRPSLSNVPTTWDLIATGQYRFPLKPRTCTMIQWERPYIDMDGHPVCPKCGALAGPLLGVFGNPCYGHL